MRWSKIKKLAFDHPYFEYRQHLLSETEVEQILRAGYISVEEFMQNVKAQCESQATITLRPELVLPKTPLKKYQVKGRFVRKLAISCAIILFAFIFLTFTEPGIAFAHAVRNFIVQIFDGSLNAQGTVITEGLPPIDFETIPEMFSSLDEAAKVIGRPVADMSGAASDVVSIRAFNLSDASLILKTEYRLNTGQAYFVTQEFIIENVAWSSGASTGGEEVIETVLPNGITVYTGNYDDGMVFGRVLDQGININIQSATLTSTDIFDLASELCFIEPQK